MMRALVVVSLVGASGCAKVTYVNTTLRPTGVVVEHTGNFFIAGLVGHADIDAYRDCPTGVAGVLSEFTFVDVLLSIVTLDLYTPRTYSVACGAPS